MAWDKDKDKDKKNKKELIDESVAEQFKPTTELVDDNSVGINEGDNITQNNKDEQNNFEFDFDDEVKKTKHKLEVFSVYGAKNDGKTTICYGIPDPGDKVLVFSFDNKSDRPLDEDYDVNFDGIIVRIVNAIKFLNKSNEEKYLASSTKTHNYIVSMLEQSESKFKPDWVMFDGTDVMNQLMEIVMRSNNNLKPYQGIANRSLWRERGQYIDDLHIRSGNITNKGIIYTMYSQKDEIIVDGNVQKKTDVPKWLESVMRETDVVIKAETKTENGKREFFANVEGSKLPKKYPDGRYNVTGVRFKDAIQNSKK